MTTNFGCCERSTMASQPSVHNEERNLLRQRAWEQRNQETNQAKELNPENVPLFGQPYKTNKGDELSSRIQRMLGSYEDVNNPSPFTAEPVPIPSFAAFPQSDQSQPDTEKTTRPPFQGPYISTQNQKAPSANGHSSLPTNTSAAASPNRCSRSSTFPNHSQLGHAAHQHNKKETHSDLRVPVSLSQEMSSHSPDAKPLPSSCPGVHSNNDLDTKGLPESGGGGGSVDIATFHLKQSPKDASLSQANKGNALPSQTFPSLLSKQPSVVMTQKPTAYVRPMDGQDQVVSESPELKPSPEPYVPLSEIITKSDLGKGKILPPFLETKTNEAQCVEDILREMTHSLPPLLTAIHTPSTGEPSKSPFVAKEEQQGSSCSSGQKNVSSPADASQLVQQNSAPSSVAAHSRGAESTSSSDSESSCRSESDSEGTTGETRPVQASDAVKSEPDAPAVSQVDWQLGNWIRSSQQSSSAEGQSGLHVSESHKQPPPTQTSKHSSVQDINPTRELNPQLSSRHKELPDGPGKPQQYSETPQDSQKPLSAALDGCSRKLVCTTYSSKPGKTGCPDQTEATSGVKFEGDVASRGKEPCFTGRPKVKTKTGHGKKSQDATDRKRDTKRTCKQTSLDKRKTGSEPDVAQTVYGHCPNPCPCPSPNPAQVDPVSPAAPVRISGSKKSDTVSQKSSKISHKKNPKHAEKTGPAARSSQDQHKGPRSLLVKIDLSVLARVPQVSSKGQRTQSNAKRSVVVTEQDVPMTHKHTKASKKTQNVEVDNKTIPRKKPRLENKNTSSSHASLKLESSSSSTENRERKKAKTNPVTAKDSAEVSKLQKASSAVTQEPSKDTARRKGASKQKRSGGKHQKLHHSEKTPPGVQSSSQPTRALTNRPLLRFESRQYPVKHYIKEAKKLKHKADAEPDKLSKAFNYLDAAMFFVESGIAMEKDPQISMSSYTMFAETVELLKFVLKLKNSVDSSAPPAEKDFLALCLKCHSLLHMAMFRHKHKTAVKYSKTLTDHFSNSSHKTHDPTVSSLKAGDTPSPMPSMPSPAITSSSSGPGSNQSGADPSGSVAVPQAIQQVAFSYVNITTLFLSAHDIWEQAEELARNGSGMLTELDTVLGPLNLSSTMSSMVQYTRQGVHWLRLDSQKVK
ncbi:uncharacterized protein V6R79_004677 [Siganus canaliculatus]